MHPRSQGTGISSDRQVASQTRLNDLGCRSGAARRDDWQTSGRGLLDDHPIRFEPTRQDEASRSLHLGSKGGRRQVPQHPDGRGRALQPPVFRAMSGDGELPWIGDVLSVAFIRLHQSRDPLLGHQAAGEEELLATGKPGAGQRLDPKEGAVEGQPAPEDAIVTEANSAREISLQLARNEGELKTAMNEP